MGGKWYDLFKSHKKGSRDPRFPMLAFIANAHVEVKKGSQQLATYGADKYGNHKTYGGFANAAKTYSEDPRNVKNGMMVVAEDHKVYAQKKRTQPSRRY